VVEAAEEGEVAAAAEEDTAAVGHHMAVAEAEAEDTAVAATAHHGEAVTAVDTVRTRTMNETSVASSPHLIEQEQGRPKLKLERG
jgi:uncharacterized protein with GYD domain